MSNLRSLYAEKKDVFAGIQDLEKRVAKEGRTFTADESEQWEKQYARMDELVDTIDKLEKTRELEKREAAQQKQAEKTFDNVKGDANEKVVKSFQKYFKEGKHGLSVEDRKILESVTRGTDTQITTTDSLGGFLVPEFWYNEIISFMEHYSGSLEAARLYGGIINSNNGGQLNIPTTDDTATKAVLVGEGSSTTVADFTFANKVLNSYTYRTMAKVSEEQLNDSAYNMIDFLSREFGKRFGRAANESTTTGDGSDKPNGFMSASSAGVTTSATDAFTRQEILNLIESVDRAYRFNAAFQIPDSALFDIRALTIGSADDRPLWQPSIREGEPDRIEGFPYIVNNDIESPDDGAGSKIMAFGDWSYFKIRLIGGQVIKRLDERYAENLEVALLGFQRWDSELIDTNAIKHMITAAS